MYDGTAASYRWVIDWAGSALFGDFLGSFFSSSAFLVVERLDEDSGQWLVA